MNATPGLELAQRVDQRPGQAGEPVVAPDQEYVEAPLAGGLEHGAVLGPIILGAAGVVDVLVRERESSPLGILPELAELGLRVLAPIGRGHPGVDGGSSHASILTYPTRSAKKRRCFSAACPTPPRRGRSTLPVAAGPIRRSVPPWPARTTPTSAAPYRHDSLPGTVRGHAWRSEDRASLGIHKAKGPRSPAAPLP